MMNGSRYYAGLALVLVALAWIAFVELEWSGGSEDRGNSVGSKQSELRPAVSYVPVVPHHAIEVEGGATRFEAGGSKVDDAALLSHVKMKGDREERVEVKLTLQEQVKAARLGAKLTSGNRPKLVDVLAGVEEGEDGMSSGERVAAVRDLAVLGMTGEDIGAAYGFLEAGVAPVGMTDSAYRWVADEVLISLREQEVVPGAFVERLAGVAGREDVDPVVRDYSVQHLGHYHGEGGDRRAIEAALWKATEVKEGTMAGTAFIALQRMEKAGSLAGKFDLDGRGEEISIGEASAEAKQAVEVVNEGKF